MRIRRGVKTAPWGLQSATVRRIVPSNRRLRFDGPLFFRGHDAARLAKFIFHAEDLRSSEVSFVDGTKNSSFIRTPGGLLNYLIYPCRRCRGTASLVFRASSGVGRGQRVQRFPHLFAFPAADSQSSRSMMLHHSYTRRVL